MDIIIKDNPHNGRVRQIHELIEEAKLMEQAAMEAERRFDHEKAEEARRDKRTAQSLIGMLVINSLTEQGEL